MQFLQSVHTFIARHGLLAAGERVLVAISGGADSVALLLVLKQLGYDCVAAHCNFRLRGAESDSDEQFVRALTAREGIALHCTSWDTASIARQRGVSIEMAARDLRYEWFAATAAAEGINTLCTGHHAADNAETFFLNLTRCTGLTGLAGMRPLAQRGPLRIARPLLGSSRKEIEAFLTAKKQAYVTDSTNADTAYRRNLIRHELLPLLRRINPSFDETLIRTMRHVSEANDFVGRRIQRRLGRLCRILPDGVALSTESLRQDDLPELIVFALLRPFGFPPTTAEDIIRHLDDERGTLYQHAGYLCTRTRHTIEVRRCPTTFHAMPLSTGHNALPDGTNLNVAWLNSADIVADKHVACLDADNIGQQPLTCRSVRRGDRFAPYGMHGTKLISDFLADRGYGRISRMAAKVVLAGDDIVWVVGERPAQRYAIGPATRRQLRITLE